MLSEKHRCNPLSDQLLQNCSKVSGRKVSGRKGAGMFKHRLIKNSLFIVLNLAFTFNGVVSFTDQMSIAQAEAQQAVVFSSQGTVSVLRAGSTIQANETLELLEGDEIIVGSPGRVALKLADGSFVRLPAGARMRLAGSALAIGATRDGGLNVANGSAEVKGGGDKSESGVLKLLSGALHFFSHSEKHPTVITDHVTAAIRGTEFTLTVNQDSTAINILSGIVDGTAKNGAALLRSGDGARFSKAAPPQVYKLVSSDRSVQWSLFVPFLGSDRDLARLVAHKHDLNQQNLNQHEPDKQRVAETCATPMILKGRELILSGDAVAGLKMLESCTNNREANTPLEINREFAVALSTLVRLAQGDVPRDSNQPGSDQPGSHQLNGNNQVQGTQSKAGASQVDSKVSQTAANKGKVEPVLTSAGGAPRQLDISKLAASFLYQERGDLEQALAALGEARSDEAQEIRARRAEVTFMMGDVPQAQALLTDLGNPMDWYSRSIAAFLAMADRDFDRAKDLFNEAVTIEPSAGLPQMGLGLLAVNQGRLAEGRERFERAVALEPGRSIFRSYLGKSYFEADNYSAASPEYARAKELDPNDPTPHLYQSFMQLAENQPVDALRSIEKAQALSDKRSVYRSKMLLDEDAAVQSASLARTYRDLGFTQRGKIEAISAITSDYKNASAHRLLAESQDGVASAEASLSERKMADLFAPLSINVADSIGSNVSLNEYSSLFEKDGWRTGVSTGFSSLGDIGTAGVVTANKSGNYVTGLSASGSVNSGLQTDPQARDGRVGVTFQGQPSWADRFIVEGKGTFTADRQSYKREFADDEHFDQGTFSAAYLHKFTPDTSAVLHSSYERARELVNQRNYGDQLLIGITEQGEYAQDLLESLVDTSIDRYNSLWVNEAQLISKGELLTSIVTLRSSTSNLDNFDDRLVVDDGSGLLQGQGVVLQSQAPLQLQSETAAYLGTISLSDDLFLNGGAAYEQLEWSGRELPPFTGETLHRSHVSPKVGVIYKPSSQMMLRAGYGESLGKGYRADLASIEPTLIGGITQRYNDLPGTYSKNLGFGADFKPFDDTYFGAEWSHRWLDESQVVANYSVDIDLDAGTATRGISSVPAFKDDVTQDLLNSYWYHLVSRQWAIGSDYRFVQEEVDLGDSSLKDHKARAFSRYFLAGGYFIQSSAAYRYQDRVNNSVVQGASSGGWLFGLGAGYRLPHRGGLILAEVDNLLGKDFNLDQTGYFNDLVASDPLIRISANFNF